LFTRAALRRSGRLPSGLSPVSCAVYRDVWHEPDANEGRGNSAFYRVAMVVHADCCERHISRNAGRPGPYGWRQSILLELQRPDYVRAALPSDGLLEYLLDPEGAGSKGVRVSADRV